jgi:hypothetical protein
MVDTPYCQTARFDSKEKAGEVYFPIQVLIFEAQDDCDLSAYRLKITEGWHVVVLGEQPPETLYLSIEALLTQGTFVNLESIRPDVFAYLQDRRAEAIQIAPWIEVHHDTKEE